MSHSKTILVVDDEPRTREGLSRILTTWCEGRHEILIASNGRQALEILHNVPVHLLITDIRMPEVNGMHLIDTLLKEPYEHKPVVIVISGYADFDYAQKALQLGVVDYLLKPFRRLELIQSVENAMQIDDQRTRVERMSKIVDAKLLETDPSDLQVNDSIKEAKRFVDEHLHEALSLRQVAEHVHLNSSYFSVLFKEQLRVTFSEYITRCRVQKARELLLHTKLPIAEISEQVGYKTAKYFTTIFKEYEGVSPGQFRSKLQSKTN